VDVIKRNLGKDEPCLKKTEELKKKSLHGSIKEAYKGQRRQS
jgi:hypothetical protein